MLIDISHYEPGFAEGVVYRAVVIDNVDPTNQGRVKVVIPRIQINTKPYETPTPPSNGNSGHTGRSKDKVNFIWARPVALINSAVTEKTVINYADIAVEQPHERDNTIKKVEIGADLKETKYVPCSGSLRIPRIHTKVFVVFEDGDPKKCYYLPFGPTLESEYINMTNVENYFNSEFPAKRVNIDVIRAWQNGNILYADTNDNANTFILKFANGHRLKFEYNKFASGITINTELGHIIKLIDKSENEGGDSYTKTWNKFDNNEEDKYPKGTFISVESKSGHKILLDDNEGNQKIHVKTTGGHVFDMIDQSSDDNGSFWESYYKNHDAKQTQCSHVRLTTSGGHSLIFFDKGGQSVHMKPEDLFGTLEIPIEHPKELSAPAIAGILVKLKRTEPINVRFFKTFLPNFTAIMMNINDESGSSTGGIGVSARVDNGIEEGSKATTCITCAPAGITNAPCIIPNSITNLKSAMAVTKNYVGRRLTPGVNALNSAVKDMMTASAVKDNYYTHQMNLSIQHSLLDANYFEKPINANTASSCKATASKVNSSVNTQISPKPNYMYYWSFDGWFNSPTAQGQMEYSIKEAIDETLWRNMQKAAMESHPNWKLQRIMIPDNLEGCLTANQFVLGLIYTKTNAADVEAEKIALRALAEACCPPWLRSLICCFTPVTVTECLIKGLNKTKAAISGGKSGGCGGGGGCGGMLIPDIESADDTEDTEENVKKYTCDVVNYGIDMERDTSPSKDTSKHTGDLEMTGKPFFRAVTPAGNYMTFSDYENTFRLINMGGSFVEAVDGKRITINTPGDIIMNAGKNVKVTAGMSTTRTTAMDVTETAGTTMTQKSGTDMTHMAGKNFTQQATANLMQIIGQLLTSQAERGITNVVKQGNITDSTASGSKMIVAPKGNVIVSTVTSGGPKVLI